MSPIRHTARGFAVYAEFKDLYDAQVDVIKSSLATEPCVWIHVLGDEEAYAKAGLPNNKGSIHLTPDMANQVIAALSEWLKEVAFDQAVAKYRSQSAVKAAHSQQAWPLS